MIRNLTFSSNLLFLLLLFGIFSINTQLLAQTNVSGNVGGQVWTLAGSPYKVTSNIKVQSGTTLEIEPGVEVLFMGQYKLTVNGRLLAIGEADNYIKFTPNSQYEAWIGIIFENPSVNDSSKIIYSIVEHTNTVYNAGITFNNFSKATVQRCIIRHNYGRWGGGVVINSSAPYLAYNLITNNYAQYHGGGVYFSGANNAKFINNIVCNNTAGTGGGISARYSNALNLVNNTICNNYASGNYGGVAIGYGELNVINNIIWGNEADNDNSQLFTNYPITLDYNCIQDLDLTTYPNNIKTNPLFINPTPDVGYFINVDNANWALRKFSPAINAGDPNIDFSLFNWGDMNANPRQITSCNAIDMGAYEYQLTDKDVYGTISNNTVWSDTVLVICDVTVADGATLTILPGTKILFDKNFQINIYGELLAQGTSTDSIYFSSYNAVTGSGNLRFYNNAAADSKFSYCHFSGGNATGGIPDKFGGAIYVENYSNILIQHSVFENNTATAGGAIYSLGSDVTIENSRFRDNTASWGGVFVSSGDNSFSVRYCEFENNSAGNTAGVAVVSNSTNVEIVYSKILNNTTTDRGGAFFIKEAAPEFYNNLITGNTGGRGGAIYCDTDAQPLFINNNIMNNLATDYGGAVYCNSTAAPQFTNSIFWNNHTENSQTQTTLNQVAIDELAVPVFEYSLVQGGLGEFELLNSTFLGTYENNIEESPQFLNSSQNDFRLLPLSPCINAGKPSIDVTKFPVDWNNFPRIYNDTPIDIGITEFQYSLPVCGTIDEFLWHNDTIRVECDVVIPPGQALTILPGVVVEVQGNYKIFSESAIIANGTASDSILFIPAEGVLQWKGIELQNVTSDSSFFKHCRIQQAVKTTNGGAIAAHNSLISISNSKFLSNSSQGKGGAVYTNLGAKISNADFSFNYAEQSGAALYCNVDSLSIINSNFFNNIALSHGGAVFCENAKTYIINSHFFENQATQWYGGAIYLLNTNTVFVKNKVDNNNAGYGGGIYVRNSDLDMLNCELANNQAVFDGGAIYYHNSDGEIWNNTIVNNYAENGAAFYFEPIAMPIVQNTVLWGNISETGGQIFLETEACQPNFYYSNIENGLQAFQGIDIANYTGIFYKNKFAFPAFVNASAGSGNTYNGYEANWQPLAVSSLANAGNPATDFTKFSTDLAGNPRLIDFINPCDIIDIGAYECQNVSPSFVFQDITENTMWDADTVNIICDISIKPGITLDISAGTIVNFTGNYQLTNQGIINAEGTENNPIVFTNSDTLGYQNNIHIGWGGIRFVSNNSADSSRFVHCHFQYGKAVGSNENGRGGAIYSSGFSKILISNCLFQYNRAETEGAAIYCNNASPLIVTSEFSYNKAFSGGAIVANASMPRIYNSIFYWNWAQNAGALVFQQASGGAVVNSTIANNLANSISGAIFCEDASAPQFQNTILWNNSILTGNRQVALSDNSQPDFMYCIIEGGSDNFHIYGGHNYSGYYQNNQTENPLFYDLENSEFGVKNYSPCINNGNPSELAVPIPFDFEGNTRVFADTIDIGAYEYINHAPVELLLSNQSVTENLPENTTVGIFTTTDPDIGDLHTYSLMPELLNNEYFTIVADTLKAAVPLNYESFYNGLSIWVKTTDNGAGNLSYEKELLINVNDVNEAPTNMLLSNNTIPENSSPTTLVGQLSGEDPDFNTTYTFTLTENAYNNNNFTLIENKLYSAVTFNYEEVTEQIVEIKVEDEEGLSYTKTFDIEIININDPPTALLLNGQAIDENLPGGELIGTLSVEDEDADDQHTFELADLSYADRFEIVDNQLFSVIPFNYELQAWDIVPIIVHDNGEPDLTYENIFFIQINDVNEMPTGIELSNNSIDSNAPVGSLVGILSAIDEDLNQTYTYSFIDNPAYDNDKFQISGNELNSAEALLNLPDELLIGVTVEDEGGLTTDEEFTIYLNNMNYSPSDILLSNNEILENKFPGTQIGTLSTADPNSSNYHQYSLVDGFGDDDNGNFTVIDNKIYSNFTFNFEEQNVHSIRLRATDNGTPALSFEKQLFIIVNDINEPPVVQETIEDFYTYTDSTFLYQIPFATFFDEDENDEFSYAATQSNGLELPDWIQFNAEELTLSGMSRLPGEIAVRITAADTLEQSTSDDFMLYVQSYVGINHSLLSESNVGVAPNPTDGIFRLSVDGASTAYRLFIRNLAGVTIASYTNNRPETALTIDLTSYPAGVYIIEVVQNNQRIFKRLIVY